MQSVLLLCQVVLVVGVCMRCGIAETCDRKHVTLAEMRRIVIGRCYDFQTTMHPEHFCTTGVKNCTDLWEKISAVLTGNTQCNVTAAMYAEFIEAANHPVTGKQLFYSGLYGFAQRYSAGGTRYTTVENTLIGYLVDGISFCGGGGGGEIITEPCEEYNPVTCPYTASGSYWEAASVNFARNAVGHVYVLLTTARNPIVKETSYFFKYEVPNLRNGTVTRLSAFLINESPSSKRDPCHSDDSMKMLKSFVEAKNIAFDCEENRSDLVLLYCMDNPTVEVCQLSTVSASSKVLANVYQLCFLLVIVELYSLL